MKYVETVFLEYLHLFKGDSGKTTNFSLRETISETIVTRARINYLASAQLNNVYKIILLKSIESSTKINARINWSTGRLYYAIFQLENTCLENHI